MKTVFKQCESGEAIFGGIVDLNILKANHKSNRPQENLEDYEIGNFDQFLEKRRELMADKIKDYYKLL